MGRLHEATGRPVLTAAAAALRDESLDHIVKTFKRDPNGPLGDTAPAIERLLAAGAS